MDPNDLDVLSDLSDGDLAVVEAMAVTLKVVHANKPNDRIDLDRRYAVAINDLEHALGTFVYWVRRYWQDK